MLITNEAFRSPLSNLTADRAETYWTAAELALHQTWFLVSFSQPETEHDKSVCAIRTMLLSRLEDLEALAQMASEGELLCEAAYVVTPGHVNGESSWKMEKLKAVWTAEEPNVPRQMVQIFEVASGTQYARSTLDTPMRNLLNKALRFRIPAPPGAIV